MGLADIYSIALIDQQKDAVMQYVVIHVRMLVLIILFANKLLTN